MTDENKQPEGYDEVHGLDSLIQDAEQDEINQQRAEEAAAHEAAQPSDFELEKARMFAKQMNTVFLFAVDKAVCPSVSIHEHVEREDGEEAFLPLAQAMGGEIPPWLARLLADYAPYIGAGMYMGTTVFMARKLEREFQAEQEAKERAAKAKPVQPDTEPAAA